MMTLVSAMRLSLEAAFHESELIDQLCLCALTATCNVECIRTLTASVAPSLSAAALERTREAVFQCIAVAGAPRVIDALNVFREACGAHANQLSTAVPASRDTAAMAAWPERGAATFAAVYDEKATLVRTVMRRGAPSLELVIVSAIYGAVLADESLPLLTRELINCICLRAMSAEPQAVGHEKAALRLGANEAQINAMRAAALAALRHHVLAMHAKLEL